jgi:hypothetical protein
MLTSYLFVATVIITLVFRSATTCAEVIRLGTPRGPQVGAPSPATLAPAWYPPHGSPPHAAPPAHIYLSTSSARQRNSGESVRPRASARL